MSERTAVIVCLALLSSLSMSKTCPRWKFTQMLSINGESITVSGLITGADIVSALEGKTVGEKLIIPPNCLRSEGDMFLDNMTIDELSEKLGGVKVTQNGPSGGELLEAWLTD